MTTRFAARLRPVKAFASPRELIGESLPELLLFAAVVAAVVSVALGLDGVI